MDVTSYAEVWIEMHISIAFFIAGSVTSYAEVWIEMSSQ